MRVGISLTSNHPGANDPRQAARWMIERAAAARRSALDSLFIGDQHVSATPYYQNTSMFGRLLAEWGDAPAGCLFLLPCGTRCWWPSRSGRIQPFDHGRQLAAKGRDPTRSCSRQINPQRVALSFQQHVRQTLQLHLDHIRVRLGIQKIGVETIRKFDAGSAGGFRISNIADLGAVTLQRLAVALHPVKRL